MVIATLGGPYRYQAIFDIVSRDYRWIDMYNSFFKIFKCIFVGLRITFFGHRQSVTDGVVAGWDESVIFEGKLIVFLGGQLKHELREVLSGVDRLDEASLARRLRVEKLEDEIDYLQYG